MKANLLLVTGYLREIKLYDGRPAYILLPYIGGFPTKAERNGKHVCPYCGNELKNDACSCYSFKRITEFNAKLNNP